MAEKLELKLLGRWSVWTILVFQMVLLWDEKKEEEMVLQQDFSKSDLPTDNMRLIRRDL